MSRDRSVAGRRKAGAICCQGRHTFSCSPRARSIPPWEHLVRSSDTGRPEDRLPCVTAGADPSGAPDGHWKEGNLQFLKAEPDRRSGFAGPGTQKEVFNTQACAEYGYVGVNQHVNSHQWPAGRLAAIPVMGSRERPLDAEEGA